MFVLTYTEFIITQRQSAWYIVNCTFFVVIVDAHLTNSLLASSTIIHSVSVENIFSHILRKNKEKNPIHVNTHWITYEQKKSKLSISKENLEIIKINTSVTSKKFVWFVLCATASNKEYIYSFSKENTYFHRNKN